MFQLPLQDPNPQSEIEGSHYHIQHRVYPIDLLLWYFKHKNYTFIFIFTLYLEVLISFYFEPQQHKKCFIHFNVNTCTSCNSCVIPLSLYQILYPKYLCE